jgi:hypothetical protein
MKILILMSLFIIIFLLSINIYIIINNLITFNNYISINAKIVNNTNIISCCDQYSHILTIDSDRICDNCYVSNILLTYNISAISYIYYTKICLSSDLNCITNLNAKINNGSFIIYYNNSSILFNIYFPWLYISFLIVLFLVFIFMIFIIIFNLFYKSNNSDSN